MKITQQKRQFSPVTITLDTYEEVVELAAALGPTTSSCVKAYAKGNFGVALSSENDTIYPLFRALAEIVERGA